jgi:inhibitor of cysteine peptidase
LEGGVAMPDVVVTEADLGREVVALVGDALVVQLPENPTTGFRWALASFSSNTLELARDEFQTAAEAGVGGGGLRMLRFVARRAGKVRIELKLARAWESGPPKAVFGVDVKIS